MSAFNSMVERVLSHEGGYVNNPDDPGGETQWGISKRSYPHIDIKSLTRNEAIGIYKSDFWDRVDGDKLKPSIAFQVFDAAVNHGIGNAVRWLQRSVGVADDGHIGPVSHAAIAKQSTCVTLIAFNAVRLKFYTKLSTFPTFGKGWTNRIASNLEYAISDLRASEAIDVIRINQAIRGANQ